MILKPDKQYTFPEIFELNVTIADLLNELGYAYCTQRLDLARSPIPSEIVQQLQDKFYRRSPNISFNSEAARREFIISQILWELVDHAQLYIEVEYKTGNERLRGNLDYLLRGEHHYIIIEAKNDEMERGFRQLAVELIAAADHLKLDKLYGAVTTGEFWRFGLLDREKGTITRDINSFTIPAGLAELMETLAGLIERGQGST